MGPRQSVNCKFDDENNVDIQAIRNHLDQQYIGPFHAETTWKVVLATLGAEAAIFILWKLWKYRQYKAKKRAGQLPKPGQQPQGGWPVPPPPSFPPPPPPPMYDYVVPQRAAWTTPGYARNMALGWEDQQVPPINKNKKKGRKPDAQSRLETLKGGNGQEEEEEDGE